MKALLGIKGYWESRLPLVSYVDHEIDRLAASIISNTIHEDLKNVTGDSNNAYNAMRALQKHVTRGRRTNQFSLSARMVNLQLDLNQTKMLAHMASIDSLMCELESTGFTWTGDSFSGLLYQLHMPPEMTKEINKDLNH